ncbi:MAG: LysM peptidoglycan-binding domain-containing protein [Kiritimatiellae bacterium]|nr:LysM peptidoglycan-binding domain-containing protein [Kiritimatiellia bacterium]
MKTHVTILMILVVGAGCVTTQQRRSEQASRERDIEALRADVYRIKEQTGSASSGYEQVYADIERLRREQSDGDKELADRLDKLELRLREQDAALDAMHKQIVSELSRKMAAVIKSQAPASGSGYGREHVVKTGQTLSEIASAYGVTVKTLVRANGLKDANSIRVGQKIFIPE